MKWSLLELRKYQETPLTFHETLDLKAALMKRDNLILDVAPVEVEGLVSVDKKGYIVHYTVQTTLTVPSTRSLEPVELPMDFSVDEVFMTEEQFQSRDEQMSADEILLIEGDWEVVSEEEYQRRKMEEAENKIDPRLAKLSELFDSKSKDDDNK